MFEKSSFDEIPSLSVKQIKETGAATKQTTDATENTAERPAELLRQSPQVTAERLQPRPQPVAEAGEQLPPQQPEPVAGETLPANVLSVLSSSVVVKGEISADDEIVIHGTVEGTIAHDMKKVVVGKEGRVRALIHANIVVVQGHVDGDIHGSESVELLEGARVEGDIFCPSFRMEKGARFNGTVHMPP